MKATELGIGDRGVAEIKQQAAQAFLHRWMMLRFASIDLSFTERPWWLRLDRDTANKVKVVEAYNKQPAPPDDPAFTVIGKLNRFLSLDKNVATNPSSTSTRRSSASSSWR